MRPVLPQSGCKVGCMCFVCSVLASRGSMLTVATSTALETKVLVEEPGSSSAALPYMTQQLDH